MRVKETWNSNLFKHANIYFYLTYIIVVIVIICYGSYNCLINKKDILQYKWFKQKYLKSFDGWLFSHFILFFIMGYLFPHSIRLSFLFSVIWELFEYLGNWELFEYLTSKYGLLYLKDKGCSHTWWYAKWEDIVINLIGLLIGRALRLGFVL